MKRKIKIKIIESLKQMNVMHVFTTTGTFITKTHTGNVDSIDFYEANTRKILTQSDSMLNSSNLLLNSSVADWVLSVFIF